MAAASSPHQLLQFYHDNLDGRRLLFAQTLADFVAADQDCMPCNLLVSASTPAEAVAVRDALRGKVPVPGCGMLPAAWIPEELRRRAAVESAVCEARDVASVLRVLQAQRAAGHATAGGAGTALACVGEFAAARTRFTAADFAAAHVEALHALRAFSANTAVVLAALTGET
jgi:hypothetical protein